jgi:hypothetical protein
VHHEIPEVLRPAHLVGGVADSPIETSLTSFGREVEIADHDLSGEGFRLRKSWCCKQDR